MYWSHALYDARDTIHQRQWLFDTERHDIGAPFDFHASVGSSAETYSLHVAVDNSRTSS